MVILMSKKDWLVYMVQCADGTFYTGCTNNLAVRLKAHNEQNGAKYTRGRTPVKLVYSEENLDHSQALKREHAIKKMIRKEKEELASLNILQ